MARFCRYELRTTDVQAARAFYADLLGATFWSSQVALAPLPERAAARGAPAHWLGQVGVSDVDGTIARLVEMGGQQLSPEVLRDPFGSVVGLCAEDAAPPGDTVAWHLLHTRDHVRAFSFYETLFGWTANGLVDLGSVQGEHQLFAWDATGRSAGSVANTARLPHIHPHWLFFFAVEDLEGRLATVRERGGRVAESGQALNGGVFAACEDPAGAAFGLRGRAGGST